MSYYRKDGETTMRILKDPKQYVALEKENLKSRIKKLRWTPKLAIIQVGENEASNRYVRNKVKDCEEVGIAADVYGYPENTTEFELDDELTHLQEYYDGVIVQLPLPQHIRPSIATAAINPEKDVDGFRHDSCYNPATPQGIINYLKWCGFEFEGRHAVVIGRSEIVGKPMARMLLEENMTVTVCHSRTAQDDMGILLTTADLVVCAVGKPEFLDCHRTTAPVIDVGINFDENGKLVGDCYNTEGRDVTPVPGGVGLLTRIALLENVVMAAETKEERENATK